MSLSLYLFAMAMEFFSSAMTDCDSRAFLPTPYVRGDLAIFHLLFADDLMIFASSSPQVARCIKNLLTDFKRRERLGTNSDESRVFSSNCSSNIRSEIAEELGIREHRLPITYLGLPLFSSRLSLSLNVSLLLISSGEGLQVGHLICYLLQEGSI